MCSHPLSVSPHISTTVGEGRKEGVGREGGGATVQVISRNEADNLQRSQINVKRMCGCGRAVPSG